MNTTNRIGRWSVIFGIIIVLNLFFNYALSLVYKAPVYNDFCPTSQVVNTPTTQNECVAQGGQWTSNPSYGPKAVPVGINQPVGYCDLQYTCRQHFDNAQKTYNKNVFIILVVLGALSVAIGNLFASNEVIGSGLSLAGVLSFIIASGRYWGSANDWTKLFILAVALGILFWVAIRKFRN